MNMLASYMLAGGERQREKEGGSYPLRENHFPKGHTSTPA
jgi:hypothetical protein